MESVDGGDGERRDEGRARRYGRPLEGLRRCLIPGRWVGGEDVCGQRRKIEARDSMAHFAPTRSPEGKISASGCRSRSNVTSRARPQLKHCYPSLCAQSSCAASRPNSSLRAAPSSIRRPTRVHHWLAIADAAALANHAFPFLSHHCISSRCSQRLCNDWLESPRHPVV